MALKESVSDKISKEKSMNLPYPLSELENRPRAKFLKGEMRHYIFFWSTMGAISGLGLGFLSFYRKHRYRKWVNKQPQAVQLKILEKNNIISNPGIKPQTASTRFSTMPNAMDTRIKLPYSHEYKPYQWYEFGPLKLWNNFGHYPWASECFTELGKWCIRLFLLCGVTLSFEATYCMLFGYPLGTNMWIRGLSGSHSGYIVAKIASEGCLFWYQQLALSMGLGALWMMATWYNRDWGQLARDHQFIIELYSSGLHKAVKKHYDAKDKIKQLYAKDQQDKEAAYEALLAQKYDDDAAAEDVDVFEVTGKAPMSKLPNFFNPFKKTKDLDISKEIDEMPYEERKSLEQDVLGDFRAINFKRWPFSMLQKHRPQWFTLDKDKVQSTSDTAILTESIALNQNEKKDNFDMDNDNDVFNQTELNEDLSVLS